MHHLQKWSFGGVLPLMHHREHAGAGCRLGTLQPALRRRCAQPHCGVHGPNPGGSASGAMPRNPTCRSTAVQRHAMQLLRYHELRGDGLHP